MHPKVIKLTNQSELLRIESKVSAMHLALVSDIDQNTPFGTPRLRALTEPVIFGFNSSDRDFRNVCTHCFNNIRYIQDIFGCNRYIESPVEDIEKTILYYKMRLLPIIEILNYPETFGLFDEINRASLHLS